MTSLQSYEISNKKLVLRVLNLGGIITDLLVPNNKGQLTNVVLGYKNIADYLLDNFYLGCIAGRFANRIDAGKLKVDGKDYQLAINNGKNHLHGGNNAFHKVFWNVEKIAKNKLQLSYLSPHMEEGYPGNLEVNVTYELTNANELAIDYKASTDQDTVLNLTNHSYFNLDGKASDNILNHSIHIDTTKLVEVNDDQIPTGKLIDISNTPFNFLNSRNIGAAMDDYKKVDEAAIGFDHCYAFESLSLKKMAELSSGLSGIKMEVHSTEPGMQFYTGNHLTKPFQQYQALCLETQHYPDSPNQENFPTTLLKPGDSFQSKTIYKFSKI